MRYKIPLAGNPSTDVALRSKYIAAFGSPCYLSVASTFDCFYQEKEVKGRACDDAKRIAEVFGAAPYDKQYGCEPIAGTEDYSLQVGSDVANKIVINYQPAPRQTPLVMVDGMPTEVSGPYRDLVDPADVAPGYDFRGNSGMVDAGGGFLEQRDWVRAVNRKKNDGKIRSDLAGYTWTCEDGQGGFTTCKEPDFLEDPFDPVGTYPDVHHVVPMKDQRCCPWGTNSYKNAAVISRKLNAHFKNNDPPEEEVKRLNNAAAYTP